MIAQAVEFSPRFFAQKTLIAALLDRPVSHIQSVTVAGEYAIVQVKNQAFPTAIALVQLESEHDWQRTERGAALNVTIVTGGAESHAVFDGCCDCHDWAKQHEAGRPVPHCKHVAATNRVLGDRAKLAAIGTDYRALSDEDAKAAGLVALADLGF